MTPLEQLIREMIAAEGPMPLDHFMSLCLGHPQHGYYMKRDPLGDRGDFITSPEISQVFGELVGVWCISVWAAMGSPPAFHLVELGPGRGTLMADILRTTRKVAPSFAAAAQVRLVETSPVLRRRQQDTIGSDASWHERLDQVTMGPMILLANEFFDALPIRQFEKRQGRWHQRVVGLEQDKLVVGLVQASLEFDGEEGQVIEMAPARETAALAIGQRLAQHPGAALIIDYGHLASAPGDTLQAMKRHGYVGVLESPGDCDITSHVDFQMLAKALQSHGATVPPVITQRNFLLAMGLEQRAAVLSSGADLKTAETLRRQMTRLAGEDQMGNLFKVLAATSPGLATPYPFGQT